LEQAVDTAGKATRMKMSRKSGTRAIKELSFAKRMNTPKIEIGSLIYQICQLIQGFFLYYADKKHKNWC